MRGQPISGNLSGARAATALALGLAVAPIASCCKDRSTSPPGGAAPQDNTPKAEASAVTWDDPIDVVTGNAHVGPWRMNQSEFHYVDDPSVALDDDGSASVIFADNERQDIYFQRYTADGAPLLPSPVNVSRSPGIFSWLPRIATSGDDVFVLWEEIVFSGGSHGGEIFFAHSADGGRTFAPPRNLSRTTAGAGKGRLTRDRWDNGSLDLVRDSDGVLYAAWTEYEGPLRFSRSTDGGETFSDPLHVAGSDARPARGPSLAIGGGTLYLAWAVGEDAAANIHLAISTDGGRSFEAPRVAVRTGGHSDAPKLAVDGEGTVHLVYGESPAGPFTPSRVEYTRRGRDGSLEAPRTLSPADGTGASFASLRVDADGNVYVLWEHHPEPDRRARGLGFAVSRDGGDTFTAPALVPGSADRPPGVNGSLQGKLMQKLAVGPDGAVAAVNSHFRQDDRSRVRLLRGRLREATR